jgi:hypothetical protein
MPAAWGGERGLSGVLTAVGVRPYNLWLFRDVAEKIITEFPSCTRS